MSKAIQEKSDSPIAIVEEAGVAYDPTTQLLDLSKEEKRRTTALMLAIQAYKNLLIPDAAYLREATENARRGDGPKIQPGTIDAMVIAAIKFDGFINGSLSEQPPTHANYDQNKDGPIVE